MDPFGAVRAKYQSVLWMAYMTKTNKSGFKSRAHKELHVGGRGFDSRPILLSFERRYANE